MAFDPSTDPAAGEHLIGYAYRSSTIATKLGHGKTGCHYVQEHSGEMAAHPTYEACIAQVAGAGTKPSRWSKDHPFNAHMLA